MEFPRVRPGLRADAPARRVHALQLRRRRRADAEGHAVLRHARHAGHLARRLEGRRRPRADVGLGNFDQDGWELFHTDEDRAEAIDLAERAPRQGQGDGQASGSRRRASTTCCRSTTAPDGDPRWPSARRRSTRERRLRLLPGNVRPPERAAANLSGRSFKILADVEIDEPMRRASSSRTAHASAGTRCSSRTEALLRLQLPRHPAGAAGESRRRLGTGSFVLGVEFEKQGRRAQGGHRHGAPLRRRARVAEAPWRTLPDTSPSAVKASASAATAPTR